MWLPDTFWNLAPEDLLTFERFVAKTTIRMKEAIQSPVDARKQQLFSILYASNGSLPVEEIADTIHWSARQINRYFTKSFGMSVKTYASILRYRASFDHLKKGQLYPEQAYFDQPHFIKEVRKYSGVTPGQLVKNKNDRFIQFSTLPVK